MATLKRNHTPLPWGAQVEQTVFERSQSGAPRRRRSDRPPLTYDPGWDWDGSRILFSEQRVMPDGDERDCGLCALEDDQSPTSLQRAHATLSLFDVVRHPVVERRNKARSGLDDFEVIRVPRVVPIPEEHLPDPGDGWELDEWEYLDGLVFKRTYSEVARGFVGGRQAPTASGRTEPYER